MGWLPEYYHIYQDDNGKDLHGMAQIIIAKHRKGATGDVLLKFCPEFTRFENPEERRLDSKVNSLPGESDNKAVLISMEESTEEILQENESGESEFSPLPF